MKNAYLSVVLAALCLCFASCGSMGVHHKDAADVSAKLAESLLSANVLGNRGPDGRSVILISTFRNNTDLQDFAPNLIFDRTRVTLNKSGVAYCYGGVHGEGYESGPPPQYTLNFELMAVGQPTNKTYDIHLTLNDIRRGLAIWEELKEVSLNRTSPADADASKRRSTMGFDHEDAVDVSAKLAESLLSANVLRNRGPDGRSVIAISTFRNNTDLYDFDPNVIFDRIRVALIKSGVAYCYATNDANVNENRASVSAHNSVASARNDDLRSIGSSERVAYRSSGPSPHYMLSMELSEDPASVGSTTQKNYQIHMALKEVVRGLEIWEDLLIISKTRTRG